MPQLWAIFTEVQRYYDKGFTVPDDVLLLFCDNNWGYIRRTGPLKERDRRGGMGLYYHIDMNGGPWNDRWVNTSPIPKLREQFHLAYETGIDDLWIVNVGDLKPKELPIDFILRYAWDPDAIPADRTDDYLRAWAGENFGEAHADAVAALVSAYPKYNLWRKAEVQVPGIFSVVNYHESDRTEQLWQDVAHRADSLRRLLPAAMQDAYFQLVYYPTVASAGIANLYTAVTRNRLYVSQGRPLANRYADLAEALFRKDGELTRYYNDTLAGGKWKNMMQDIHIGYTQWSMPEKAVLPELVRVTPTESPALGVSVEGSEATEQDGNLALPVFDSLLASEYSVDLFNRGTGSLDYAVTPSASWLRVSRSAGTLTDEARLRVSIDWGVLEAGTHEGQLTIVSGDTRVPIAVRAVKGEAPRTDEPYFGNVSGSEFSIPAIAFNRNIPGKAAAWTLLPDLGRNEVFDNLRWLTVKLPVRSAGLHTLKVFMTDPEVVLERIVVNPDNRHPSYFGAPSVRHNVR